MTNDLSEPNQAPIHEWIDGKVRYSVYYEDTDFSGYVYHANYLKYFERGREELVGVPFVRELYERGIHFVVAKLEVSYHQPAGHGDVLEITTRMRVSASPITIVEQEAYRIGSDGQPSTKLVSARIKLVCVDKQGRTTAVPDDVVTSFRALGQSSVQ